LGIGRSGAISGHGSGDIFLALSTANEEAHHDDSTLADASFIPNSRLDRIFEAVIQAVDEAVINSMFANETMRGRNDVVVNAISHNQVRDVLQNHNVELADCG
ncbi:MAG: P1 family peptidase, partial [Gammaproteobacteria bacterium]|nr:P1 family peptidase [Gammaproteobacteria bacterium]